MATKIVNAKVEKGKIYCSTDNGKMVVVDLNEGVIYGVSGKVIKTCPMFRTFMTAYEMDNIRKAIPLLDTMGNYYFTGDRAIDTAYGIKRLKYADRLVNMGIKPNMARSIIEYHYNNHQMNKLDINVTYKTIAKVLKAVPDAPNYANALATYETVLLIAKYKSSFEGLTEKQQKFVRGIANNIGEKYIPEIAGWVRFDHFDMLGNRLSWSYSSKDFWNSLNAYIDFCERHNIEIPKRGIYAHLCTTFMTYLSVKDEEKNVKLIERYNENSTKFFYENENFTMIFPKTVQDFVAEGDALNHCVGWNGYDDMVVQGRCVIAFIRYKDNPDKAFFTCDLRKSSYSKEWYINQFLGVNNSGIGANEKLCEFYAELKEFLKNLS